MNFALRLTLDGMVRALRLKLHEAGEDIEEAHRVATLRNEHALALLAEESRRVAMEVDDEGSR